MKTINFSIEKPCHQNWSDFAPTEKGKFCHFCSEEVIDFTNKSDEEVIEFFSKRQYNQSLCLRMTEEQLTEGITVSNVFIHFPKLAKRLATIALIGFSVTGMPVLLSGQATIKGEISDTIQPKAIDKIIKIEVPATYQTYEVQKVKTPPRVIIHEIPAEYQTVKKRKFVRKGGFSRGWSEIECISPEAPITIEIKLLKEKLKEKGFFDGVVDNVVTDDLKNALIAFKKANKLIPAFELDEDTLYLLGIEEK